MADGTWLFWRGETGGIIGKIWKKQKDADETKSDKTEPEQTDIDSETIEKTEIVIRG